MPMLKKFMRVGPKPFEAGLNSNYIPKNITLLVNEKPYVVSFLLMWSLLTFFPVIMYNSYIVYITSHIL
jgi:hypothetical protein